MKQSKHSKTRCQQRGIPKEVHRWLDRYGEEKDAGCNAVKVFFSRESEKEMCREKGRLFVKHNKKFLKAYRVESRDGTIVTTGWFHGRQIRSKQRERSMEFYSDTKSLYADDGKLLEHLNCPLNKKWDAFMVDTDTPLKQFFNNCDASVINIRSY